MLGILLAQRIEEDEFADYSIYVYIIRLITIWGGNKAFFQDSIQSSGSAFGFRFVIIED